MLKRDCGERRILTSAEIIKDIFNFTEISK